MDAAFGYVDFDANFVLEGRRAVEKEKRGRILKRQRRDAEEGGDTANVNSNDDGDGVDTSEGGLNDNDDDDDPIAAIPGSNGHHRGWVFNMIPITLPPASAGDSDSAMGGDDANGDKGG